VPAATASAALISPATSMARCSWSRTVVVAEDGDAKMDSLEAAEAETGGWRRPSRITGGIAVRTKKMCKGGAT
jgi:hypothetical protein